MTHSHPPVSSTPASGAPDHRNLLRRRLLDARTTWARDAQAIAEAQALLETRLLAVLRQLEPECLGLFWPIQGEFNPRPAALMLSREWPCRLALPWAAKAGREMHYRPWQGDELVSVDECGIPSPEGAACLPDVVLVPCLGFTPSGYRLGYGGGYFDRYLARHPEVTALGVAWSAGRIDEAALAPQPHDVPMVAVLTETDPP